MGLNIYFFDEQGKEIEGDYRLQITHNLNKVVSACGELVGKSYYEAIWRPDTLTGLENGKVPVLFIVSYLPDLIRDLIKYESVLTQYLPKNGYGTFEGLIEFLCNYLKECYTYKNEYVYCCR